MGVPLLLISNPKCGDEQGPGFVKEHVLPLLAVHGVRVDKDIVTTAAGHAGIEVLKFIDEHKGEPLVSLILASGDGTLHEIVNSVYSAGIGWSLQFLVALIPTGTANALYSSLFSHTLSSIQSGDITSVEYKLRSVRSLLRDQRTIIPLTITRTTVRSPAYAIAPISFSAVVTSTALHASILYDSESLRDKVPDLSRFKIAARSNIARWYSGIVKLRPAEGGEVTVYDQLTARFVPFIGDKNNRSEPTINGPFAYFLSTVNVDRLEPSFVISPLHSRIRPESDAMDLVVIRPQRDPSILNESLSEDDHSRFAEKLNLALSAAYRNGAHIDLKYTRDGTVREGNNHEGIHSLVEYVRCNGSWRWLNTGSEVAHLCVDGTILNIEAGGEAECQIIDTSALRFSALV